MTYEHLKDLSPIEKAAKMEKLNLIRFETYALLKGIKREAITWDMRERVKEACVRAYEADSSVFMVSHDVLLESAFRTMPEVETGYEIVGL